MAKAQDAFRTISEVSETLDTPTHVLRFWESKFSQIKPVKRAGGRRYYRPDDMALLAGIKDLLHEQGMTIKGAQKLLREKGVKYAVALGQARLDGEKAPSDAPQLVDITPKSETTDPTQPQDTIAAVEAAVAEDAIAPAAAAPVQTTLFTAPSAAAPATSDPAPAAAEPTLPPAAAPPPSPPPLEVVTDTPAPVKMPPAAPQAATPEIVAPENAPHITLPPIPEAKDLPARFFASLQKADIEVTRSKSAQIAPLVARLETIRDQLRAG